MNRQRGLSLISTLVGLLLAILSALAVMTLFRTVIQISVSAKDNATQDSVVSSGLLTAQMEIQKAGFGIESVAPNCTSSAYSSPSASANTDLILLSDAALDSGTLSGTLTSLSATAAVGNALVWHWVDGGLNYCAGLLASGGGLRSLRPTTCTAATDWATTAWTSVDLIPQGRLADGFRFSDVRTAACWPFGKSTTAAGVSMVMTASNSSSGLSSSQTICLPNICR